VSRYHYLPWVREGAAHAFTNADPQTPVLTRTGRPLSQLPVGLLVLKAGVEREPSEIAAELVTRVRDEIGPVAAFKEVRIVSALPKTRSGKILRGTIRKMADGEEWRIPATIEDAAVLDDLRHVLVDMGRAPSAATRT
jgi:propionyl-CoA synthetase